MREGGLIFYQKKLTPELKSLKKALKKKPQTYNPLDFTYTEKKIISHIEKETEKNNLNNITRTNAYLQFFHEYPEIEWTFLAHMVSRNAGWNMTDLKGSFLSRLLSLEQQRYFFSFLERSNWLIFQDAYPQLLLYKECKKREENYFHLLSHFGVSYFMDVLWNDYLQNKSNPIITVALIINEQNYIENRVVHHPEYYATLMESIEFKLQELLELNQILFPYYLKDEINVTGLPVHHFASLEERILLGKQLYYLLFDPQYFGKILDFATNQPHTGSRKDFNPQLFNHIIEESAYERFQARLENCQLIAGSKKIYSPRLKDAWQNVQQKPAEKGDWYKDWKVINYLKPVVPKDTTVDIYNEYCEGLKKLELAVLAKNAFNK
ncbi:DUF2515 family protein [Gracilibacillus xinjiangensis]|uniref:DUF2515 family protein n=1 Tax=Gracilibacillus xinjiangensis TaxID=1193282 RepID=A0ABV8WYW2_9BACI